MRSWSVSTSGWQESGSPLDENLKIATVMRCCPGQLRQHVQLNVKPGTRYAQARESMVAYELSTAAWSSAKILERNQIAPMEVDRIKGDREGKGKDKGKGKKGSPKGKGDKGKSKGKGKGSSDQKGKGKESGKSQDKGKGKSKGPCFACGKTGHRAAECWQRGQQVQQVEVEGHDSGDHGGNGGGQPSGPSTGTSSSSANTAQSSNTSYTGTVRRVWEIKTPPMLETCEIFDLAEEGEIDIEKSFTEGFEMMVTEEDMVEHFDLTKTDMDDRWTMEDNFTQEIDLFDYKMDYNDLFENVDFITLKTSKVETFEIQAISEVDLNYNAVLDLGADVSVVPMNMGSLGKRAQAVEASDNSRVFASRQISIQPCRASNSDGEKVGRHFAGEHPCWMWD